jgi:hypothetical protein
MAGPCQHLAAALQGPWADNALQHVPGGSAHVLHHPGAAGGRLPGAPAVCATRCSCCPT